MLDLTTITSCAELTSSHAKQAASSSAEIRALLEHFVAIAQPGEGCPKILMAIARLVGQDWVEGPLRVEIMGDDESTTLVVMCEYGIGILERILPAARFPVPLDEFSRALDLSPALILPLKITDEDGKMVLTPLLTPEDRIVSLAPPAFELDDKSLGEDLRKTAPPPAPQAGLGDFDELDESPHDVPTRPNLPRLADDGD